MRRSVPYALLIIACLLSLGATWYVTATTEAQERATFLTDAAETRHEVQARLDTYIEVIRAGAALLGASNEINGSEFRSFVRGLHVRERYPGMAGIGFSQRVRRSDLRPFVRMIQLDGVSRLRVWPAGQRPQYDPVLFLEPATDDRVRAAVGFDMASDPVRRDAMNRARDTGDPTLSARLTSLQTFDDAGQASFILYVPVYRVGARTATVEQRRRALMGFVFSPFRANDLLANIVPHSTNLGFEVFDGPAGKGALLHKSALTGMPRYESAEPVPVAGRDWVVVVKGLPSAGTLPAIAQGMLLIGLALSLMLFAITRAQVVGWETSTRHEAELRSSEEALRRSESELRRMVALEREARTQAEAADRTKDEFLAILSHELRTPLNAVLGWLSMLRNGAVEEGRRDAVLEVIERNARVQAQLIEDLLDVSRIIMGKVRLDLAPVLFAPVVSTVLDSIRPSAEAKGVSLDVAISVTTETIRGDAGRLQQIIWNLLSNAIKFTPAGGDVFVEVSRQNDRVRLLVRDTGLGIEPEFLPHIFERFRQADSSVTRTHSGIGLGLAIVQHLVELHGGTIEAQSEGPHRGAMFVVSFPLIPATSAVRVTVTKPPLQIPRLAGVRVLVVDDDRDTRELLTEALGESGARVTSADSARRALEVLIADGADVLVSDIGMPEEDGLSLMRRIRSLPGDRGRIPAIALTAYARTEDRLQAIDAGYQMHMTKPVALRELQAGLAKLTSEQHHDLAAT